MAKKEHKGFNLLRDQLREADKWDKIQNWVNGTARIVVIIVEFVVIVCFGARIFMDRVARNLEEDLQENHATLESYKETELRLRQLQIDLQNYRGLWNNSGQYSNTIQTVYAYIPEITNSIAVIIDNGELSINGTTTTDNIGKLEGLVKSSPDYQDTLLERYTPDSEELETNTQGQFSLRTKIKDYKREIALTEGQEGVTPTVSPSDVPQQ